ncbi:MAG: SGNH/GDSL hydrolase family protein [Armatimonadetes bacterium]|nr:SGNH/GDSL hydrolase family protein [Armatimonadota bacterium]
MMADFLVQDGQTFLFQGDSITDCGRRDAAAPLGGGYAKFVTEMVTALYPERQITYVNKGIGGNTTADLRERWDDDTIRVQPDWMSLLIGINDLHRHLFNPDPAIKVSPQQYRDNYEWLLERVTQETPAKLVLLEPFYISLSSRDTNRKLVLDLLPEYISTVHDMAAKYNALLVRMQDVYQHHLTFRDADAFCPEPVHPSHSGHIVIALEMLKALGVM